MDPDRPRLCLVRVLWGILGVTPLRFALAALALTAALAAGAPSGSARVAFILGAFAGAGFVLADPRRRMRQRNVPRPAPAEFDLEEPWRGAVRALYPSTLGLTLLAAIALAFDAVLSSVLAGVIAGLGVAGLASALEVALQERRIGGQLYSLVGASWSSRERGATTLFVSKPGV